MSLFRQDEYRRNDLKLRQLLRTYSTRHVSRHGTPLTFSFLVTNRCFLKCAHCFYYETLEAAAMRKSADELTIDEYRRMSESMEWIFMALFCGGEPFVRDDLHEIIGVFRKNNHLMWADSATNGQMTAEIIRQVELLCRQDEYKVFSLSFSIDGFEEQNDAIRGRGTFRRALETWNECKKLAEVYRNLELNFSTTINSVNQHTLAAFFKWGLDELKPDRIAVLKARQSPRGGIAVTDVDLTCYDKARAVIAEAIKQGRLGDVNRPGTYLFQTATDLVHETLVTGRRSFTCHAGKHGAWVDYNGDVNVCEVFPDAKVSGESLKMGNLRDFGMDFLALWNSDVALEVKKLVNEHPACRACTHETEGFLPSLFFEPNEIRVVR